MLIQALSRVTKAAAALWGATIIVTCGGARPTTVPSPPPPSGAIAPSVTFVQPTIEPATATYTSPPPTEAIVPTAIPVNQRTGWIVFDSYLPFGQDLLLLSPVDRTMVPFGLQLLSPYAPAWSPDWQQVAFVAEQRNPPALDIYILDAACVDLPKGCYANAHNLTEDDPGQFIRPAWSPDGTKIAYGYRPSSDMTENFKLWVMNADGSRRTRLTDIGGTDPSWSPDGSQIVFESHVKGDEWGVPEGETSCMNCGNVFVMNSDGANLRRLTLLLPDSGMPAWSPDGQNIAVVSAEGQDLASGDKFTHIYVVSADGSQAQRLTGGDMHGVAPAWSPDGSQLVFAHDGPLTGLFLLNLDGSGIVQLTDQEGDDNPAWAP